MKSSRQPSRTTIADLQIYERLCRIQQDFVAAWNQAECNGGVDQTHDLPGNATYGFQHYLYLVEAAPWLLL